MIFAWSSKMQWKQLHLLHSFHSFHTAFITPSFIFQSIYFNPRVHIPKILCYWHANRGKKGHWNRKLGNHWNTDIKNASQMCILIFVHNAKIVSTYVTMHIFHIKLWTFSYENKVLGKLKILVSQIIRLILAKVSEQITKSVRSFQSMQIIGLFQSWYGFSWLQISEDLPLEPRVHGRLSACFCMILGTNKGVLQRI